MPCSSRSHQVVATMPQQQPLSKDVLLAPKTLDNWMRNMQLNDDDAALINADESVTNSTNKQPDPMLEKTIGAYIGVEGPKKLRPKGEVPSAGTALTVDRTDTTDYAHLHDPERPWASATSVAERLHRQARRPRLCLVKNLDSNCSRSTIRGPKPSALPSQGMTDFDDRRDYRRGGGGGHFAGRKRRFREDDEYERRPPPRYQRRFERPPDDPATRARKLIWNIADDANRDASRDVVEISKFLSDNAENEQFCDSISDNIIQLVQEQPFKIPFAAAVVQYTNLQKPTVTQLVISKATTSLQTCLDAGEWRAFKLLLRFLACMQGIFEGDGVFGALDELFNKAADLQSASSDDTLGLELVKIILLTIPYAVAVTDSAFAPQAAELLTKTDIIASAPRDIDSLIDPFVRSEGSELPDAPSVISLLQRQLQSEAKTEWKLSFLPRLFQPEKLNKVSETVAENTTYPFPAFNLSSTMKTGQLPLLPEIYLSLFADQDIETVPSTNDLAACVFRDALNDTINILDFNRAIAAKFLINIENYWALEIFVPRGTTLEIIKTFSDDKARWKSEDLAIDAIFSQLFQLACPQHKMVYYHSLITETCKLAPTAVAPSLGRAIRHIYKNLDQMDCELSYRFMDWFSHHLSNFDFRWKWQEWVGDVSRDSIEPRKAFILGTIDKEVRLSFAKRIRQTLLEEYQPLIPGTKDNEIPEYKYNSEDAPFSSEARQLVRLLRKKGSDEDIGGILTTIASQAQNPDGTSEPNMNPPDDAAALLPVIDVFATTICYIGSKSLSHVLSYIERQKERLMVLSSSGSEGQKQMISSVIEYWKDVQPGVAVNIIDKLLNYTILTPRSVIEWALDPQRLEGGRALAVSWLYEMVDATVRKVTGRVRQILFARQQRGLPTVQVDVLDKTLGDEADAMRKLFEIIGDALGPVADGSADGILEGDNNMEDPDKPEEEQRLCRLWGIKWAKVFARKARVEEFVLAEGLKSLPPAAEDDAEITTNGATVGEADAGNGVTNGHDDADVALEADLDIA